MALIHNFLVLEKKYRDDMEPLILDYFNGSREFVTSYIQVDDDLILLTQDTFNRFKTVWPNDELMEGLAYYGHTVIEHDEVLIVKEVFEEWKSLFMLGDLVVTSLDEDLVLSCDEVIHTFEILTKMCEKAISGEYFILHLGI